MIQLHTNMKIKEIKHKYGSSAIFMKSNLLFLQLLIPWNQIMVEPLFYKLTEYATQRLTSVSSASVPLKSIYNIHRTTTLVNIYILQDVFVSRNFC